MKQRLLTLLLALVSVTAMWAENYPVYIGGVRLTSDNYQNITAAGGFSAVKSGAGTVTYDPATATLTLANAEIEVTQAMGRVPGIASFSLSGSVTLVLAEGTTNTVTTDKYDALFFSPTVTIEGGGTGIFTSAGDGALSFDPSNQTVSMTIRNCTVIATGRYGIDGGNGHGPLVIDNATVRATGTQGSIYKLYSFTLTNTQINSPQGAVWNETAKAICLPGSDTPITTEVVIEPDDPEMTAANEPEMNPLRYDVDKDGDLSLADLTLLANALVGKVNYPATGLAISPSTARLYTNGTMTPTVSIAPSTADITNVAWKSSNKYVATVSADGLVTAVAPGTCTITAQTLDGSNLTASLTLTVAEIVNNGDWVDLGLPSGTLWATRNVGATNPEDTGLYFAWGETTGYVDDSQRTFSWSEYLYCMGEESTLTKYNSDSSYGYNGFTDGLGTLEAMDDAATQNWGEEWCMPTQLQCWELYDNTYTTKIWTTRNGVQGTLVTSIVQGYEGNSVFFPASGYYESYTSITSPDTHKDQDRFYFWTRSTAGSQDSSNMYGFVLCGTETHPIVRYAGERRYFGVPVRPVRKQ